MAVIAQKLNNWKSKRAVEGKTSGKNFWDLLLFPMKLKKIKRAFAYKTDYVRRTMFFSSRNIFLLAINSIFIMYFSFDFLSTNFLRPQKNNQLSSIACFINLFTFHNMIVRQKWHICSIKNVFILFSQFFRIREQKIRLRIIRKVPVMFWQLFTTFWHIIEPWRQNGMPKKSSCIKDWHLDSFKKTSNRFWTGCKITEKSFCGKMSESAGICKKPKLTKRATKLLKESYR